MPTLVACLWRRVEATQPDRVPTHFGPATRLRRPKSQWNQGALATSQVEMCPRTANSGLTLILGSMLSARRVTSRPTCEVELPTEVAIAAAVGSPVVLAGTVAVASKTDSRAAVAITLPHGVVTLPPTPAAPEASPPSALPRSSCVPSGRVISVQPKSSRLRSKLIPPPVL